MISYRSTIARPYAVALFGYAKDAHIIQDVRLLLDTLNSLYQMQEVREVLDNTTIATSDRIDLCMSLLGSTGDWQRTVVALLLESERMVAVAEIYDAYLQLLHKHDNTADVTIESAHPLSTANQKLLEDALTHYVEGKKIILNYKQNPSLIGGFEAHIGDKVVCGSIDDLLRRIAI